MINFLIHRPISVIVLFVGLLILAGIGIRNTEVSLLPNLDIPVMVIQAEAQDLNPSEMEVQIMAPIRRYLLSMNGIKTLSAKSDWGNGEIRVTFRYGWDMEKAFIETNEMVDLSLNSLPQNIVRPRVIKTRAEDLPAYLLTLKNKAGNLNSDFLDLSEFAIEVLRRRLEQEKEIALVDVHGTDKLQIEIIPNDKKMATLGLDVTILQSELKNQNIPISSIQIKERNYRYLVQIGHPLHNIQQIRDIKLVVGKRVLRLSDVAYVQFAPQSASGAFVVNGEKAISLAIIKKPQSSLPDLKEKLIKIIDQVQSDFPQVDIAIGRDQTRLLEVTIENLYSSLILGCLLAVGIVFFFYSEWRVPAIMAIIIPVSLLISLLLFKAFSISINMISLSGILLGLGLMIDNGIIVLDNISQEWNQKEKLATSCILGTNEMIRPLLTSTLTTCSVFIPLVFLSDIAGALFWDQAVAISITLIVSYLVSIILLPTLYFSLIRQQHFKRVKKNNQMVKYLNVFYLRAINFSLNNKAILIFIIILFCAGAFHLMNRISFSRFPALPTEALEVSINWNEPIRPEIAHDRLNVIFADIAEPWQAHIGKGQYLLNSFYTGDVNSAEILVESVSSTNQERLKHDILAKIASLYPSARTQITSEKTTFEIIFPKKDNSVEFRCFMPQNQHNINAPLFNEFCKKLKATLPAETELRIPPSDKGYLINIKIVEMLNYNVDHAFLVLELRRRLGQNKIGKISSFQYQIPIVVRSESLDLADVLYTSSIKNKSGKLIPLRNLVELRSSSQARTIYASAEGLYVPIWIKAQNHQTLSNQVDQVAKNFRDIKVNTISEKQEDRLLLSEIFFALLASIMLLYFLMAAQFESLLLPFIVLLEIPISLSGSIYLLWLFEVSINVMSVTGMVVTIGIIINDSIIKIDAIHRLKKSGILVKEAIHRGGLKRLNPIIMTSLTTILAVLPFLWGEDLGSMLQKPLALCVIGGMTAGTLVSMFVIPIFYQITIRNDNHELKIE